MIDKRLVLLNEIDNVLVCCKHLNIGTLIEVDGEEISLSSPIDVGHKLARYSINESEKVMKYGVPIGSATQFILKGEHIHVHNMKSDYISSHSRQSKIGGTK
ncbi:UxaA family hydrolase [Shewanella sp. D64]|uniref:UxaA family hydrolase n=1 Tax=unclassified Shewanella TaxID=196818 RepID=UPI0022BA246D|nr:MULTISPECIES: UxaA family hydrolase [unclassified Shewanella]MEC4723967.1 UxaA family hydrolase [Shewanella sp. D64]MEC4735987.1 UxaA family hydrolase [Shewanella sp. E94]WBJ93050.1 UxaA family hydrolase [Shewanella sp. MTB7]